MLTTLISFYLDKEKPNKIIFTESLLFVNREKKSDLLTPEPFEIEFVPLEFREKASKILIPRDLLSGMPKMQLILF